MASAPRSTNPFGDVYEAPAAENDTEDYFGATGIASGPQARMGELQLAALTNAQNMIRQKMKHAYKGAVDDYMNSIGNNSGTDIEAKIERGGTQLIDVIVNDTQASKGPVFSAVDDKGNVNCFIGIRISKKAVADKIADYVQFLHHGRLLIAGEKDRICEGNRVVKGPLHLLTPETEPLFVNLRRSEFGFTGLTGRPDELFDLLGDEAVYEKPTVEDIFLGYTQAERGH